MNAHETFLCLDFGTSSLKVGCVTSRGELLSFSRVHLIRSDSDITSWPAERWLESVRTVIASGIPLSGCVGIVVSGNGPTLVPVDAVGSPVHPVLLWLDGRDERVADEGRSFFLPKARWLKIHRPEQYKNTRRFLGCPEYVIHALTGRAVAISPTEAFDEFIWTPQEIRAHGLEADLFPEIVRPGGFIGPVCAEAARVFGIPAGVPVIAGGPDFLMSLVGTATVDPGTVCDRAGTSEGINYCTDVNVADDRLRTLPHIVPGLFNVAGILSSTGRLFEWFRQISGQTHVSYDTIVANAAAISGATQLPQFFPALHRGASWEFSRGMFIELGAGHGPAEMGRAVIESIGYAVREAVEILEENGCTADRITVCGGQAKNRVWNQMKADIVGRVLEVPEIEDAELLGDACAGLVAIGRYPDLASAARAVYRPKHRFYPVEANNREFSRLYTRYRELYSRFSTALSQTQ